MSKGFTSVTEQVTQVIREGIQEGRWKKTLPGRYRLADELGVNHKTVHTGLRQLEDEGIIESQGPGKERLILSAVRTDAKALRVVILAYEKSDHTQAHLLKVLHHLQVSGHIASFASKTLVELGKNVDRVARFASKTDADAWILVAAPPDIIQWFATRPTPAFALYGRISRVDMAGTGPNKFEALDELLGKLHHWGHRRIVMLSREDRRKPVPAALERFFLSTLENLGIRTGTFNLPDWGDDPDELRISIDSLFRSTPPTAIILDDAILFTGVIQQLARMGLTAPEHVSLACTDYTSTFEWCRPEVTHISWNMNVTIKRVVNWTNQVSRGKYDRRKTITKAKLILGATTGPAPGTVQLSKPALRQ